MLSKNSTLSLALEDDWIVTYSPGAFSFDSSVHFLFIPHLSAYPCSALSWVPSRQLSLVHVLKHGEYINYPLSIQGHSWCPTSALAELPIVAQPFW